jgi:hypothetical protein
MLRCYKPVLKLKNMRLWVIDLIRLNKLTLFQLYGKKLKKIVDGLNLKRKVIRIT